MASDSSLVDVSSLSVLLSASPFVFIVALSHFMDLKLESPIVVGCIRCFVQLSVLGLVLQPIFVVGEEYWGVVLVYVLLMILVTSSESASRSAYQFQGMFGCVLISLVLNVAAISLFAFGLIIRPEPVFWEPQYIIPISGMILGNCINGISLSLNGLLTALVESRDEIDLLLAFGANTSEATSRILREALRTGTMPLLNGMSVIGIVSIPGMMTGQILGGSSAMEAARYQMLIMYLITIATFGSILTISLLSLRVLLDASTDTIHVDRLEKRKEKRSLLDTILICGKAHYRSLRAKMSFHSQPNGETQPLTTYLNTSSDVMPGNQIEIKTLVPSSEQVCLVVANASRSFPSTSYNDRRILFRDLSFTVAKGEILLIRGPSGCGKSSLLRLLCGLSPLDSNSGSFVLKSPSCTMNDMTQWRQHVRYLTQRTVYYPGTPRDFINRISSFRSRRRGSASFSCLEMMASCIEILSSWNMERSSLDKSWSSLSGGEAQRVILAIALASNPRVLLLDECTSALDVSAKTLVEKSVAAIAKKTGLCIIWVTHDVEQISRMSQSSIP